MIQGPASIGPDGGSVRQRRSLDAKWNCLWGCTESTKRQEYSPWKAVRRYHLFGVNPYGARAPPEVPPAARFDQLL